MSSALTEEQTIMTTQQLDLIYSQFGTLYDIIPHSIHISMELPKPAHELHASGIVGTINNTPWNQ